MSGPRAEEELLDLVDPEPVERLSAEQEARLRSLLRFYYGYADWVADQMVAQMNGDYPPEEPRP